MNWALEASVEAAASATAKWNVISSHIEDESLTASGDRIASFLIDAKPGPEPLLYRSFRIVITGENSSSTYFLVLVSIDRCEST